MNPYTISPHKNSTTTIHLMLSSVYNAFSIKSSYHLHRHYLYSVLVVLSIRKNTKINIYDWISFTLMMKIEYC